MKAIVLILIVGLIALAAIFPASAAGQNGQGAMAQYNSGSAGSGVCPNPSCPQTDCPNDQVPPRDGTGIKYGRNYTT